MRVGWRATTMLLVLVLAGPARAEEPPTAASPAADAVPAPILEPVAMSLEAARLDETIGEIRARSIPPAAVRAIVAGLDADETEMAAAATAARDRLQAPGSAVEMRDARATWSIRVDHLERDRLELEAYASLMARDLLTLEDAHDQWTVGRAALPSDAPWSLVTQADRAISTIEAVRKDLRERSHDALQAVLRVAALHGTASALLDDLDQVVRDVLFSRDSPPFWGIWADPEAYGDPWPVAVTRARQRGQDIEVYVLDAPWRIVVQVLLALSAAWLLVGSRRLPDERRPTREHLSWQALVQRPVSAAIVLSVGAGTILHVRAPSAFLDILVAIAVIPLTRVLRVLLPGVSLQPMFLLFGVYVVNRSVALLAGAEVVHRVALVTADLLALLAVAWAVRELARRAAVTGEPSARIVRWLLLAALAAFAIAVGANVLGFVPLATVIVDVSVESLYVAVVVWASVMLLDGCVRFAARLPAAQRLGMISHHGDYVEDRVGRLLLFAGAVAWAAYMLFLLSLLQPLSEVVRAALAAQLTLGAITLVLGDVLAFVVSAWLALSVSRLIRFVLDEDVLPRMHLPKGLPATVSTLTHYAVLTAGLLVALAAAGVHLDQFAFAAGALGIGIGFGLQGIANNLVCGLILLFERPIQVGDVIELGSLTGRVQHIGMRACRVRTLDGAEVIVPNSSMITDPVVNWTLSDQVRRFDVAVGVAYGSRPEQVIALLQDVVKGTPGVLQNPEPETLFAEFGASSIDFLVRAWASYDDHLAVRSAARVRIEVALREAGIEIPYPQRDLHLRSIDTAALAALTPEASSAVDEASGSPPDDLAEVSLNARRLPRGGL